MNEENQKPAEQELQVEKQEVELEDLNQELSDNDMQDVNGGFGPPSRDKRRGR
ncbi:hypothetical protein [Paenibacillus hexagrammi]|uniref:Uncharacterized protein n=1 Tax=Paenibacillus hexagrammi TaxID=2908839 RepID=A0ABY3SH96_9BACL|nr:hypothetical protein [Paenibacillus sp. YPD9-1]UJF32322.1 hypothetical protein L0M14_21810 [Paenibacillus sp. YPD9-1]